MTATHLSTHDIRRAWHFISDLYTPRTSPELVSHLVASVSTVIAADATGYNEVSSQRRLAAYHGWPPDHPHIPDAQDILGRYAYQNPLIAQAERTTSVAAHKITDFTSQRQFRNTAVYHEYYRRLQLPYNMGVKLIPGTDPLIALAFFRARRDFSPRDIALLDVISPHLLQAYQHAATWTRLHSTRATTASIMDARGQGFVTVTPTGRIQFATLLAEALLDRYTRHTRRDRGCLPPLIRRWFRHEYAARGSHERLHTPTRPLRIRHAPGLLTIRLLPHEQRAILLLEETPSSTSIPHLHDMNLRPREADVLALLAQGKTNRAIATILGITARTVQKHLEHIYARLGVDHRYAAMVAAWGKADSPIGHNAEAGLPPEFTPR